MMNVFRRVRPIGYGRPDWEAIAIHGTGHSIPSAEPIVGATPLTRASPPIGDCRND